MIVDRALTVIILAGGKSSRMGEDKALLSMPKAGFVSERQPLILNLVQLACQITPLVLIVTSEVQKYKSILPAHSQFCTEFPPFQSPMMGFLEGLSRVETEWVLLLACDLPCLTLKEVQFWLKQLRDIPKDYIALLPPSDQGWDVLCGFYRRRCYSLLQEYFQKTGDHSLQRWLNGVSVYPLKLKDSRSTYNCNTPQDYQFILNQTNQ